MSTNNTIVLATSDKGIARAAQDGDGSWVTAVLATAHQVTCLAAPTVDPHVVYAGTRNGVLRSDDGGLNWQACGMEGHIVKSLAVSPHDSQVIYAGTKPALLFVSHDGGQSWAELEGFRRIPNRWWWFSPAEPGNFRAYVIGIALSPEDPDVILAGIELGAVVRSEDGGRTWSSHRKGALRDCHSLKFHASNGRWVYEAGGTGGGASYSRDSGITFSKATDGLAKNYGIVCAADPERPEIWYVCVGSSPTNAYSDNPQVYLYRSTGDAGWQPIGWQPHPLTETPTALTVVPGEPGHLYAGLKNGHVWHTADYGDSWARCPSVSIVSGTNCSSW